MPSSTHALQVEHLAKTYVLGFFRKKVHSVKDVTFHVEHGEIFGLLGPNGAGKTTTLKLLLGLVQPTAGHATLLGHPIGNIESKARLGYLPENPYFYDYLTGRELLLFTAKLFGMTRQLARQKAERLLEQVGLPHAANLSLRRYSKGMLQRIGIAQALVNDPEFVILDEPLTGLDPLGRKELRELIAGLKKQGKTVLLSSHILGDVELLADRVAILVQGRTVDTGPLPKLIDPRILTTDIVISHPGEVLSAALLEKGYEADFKDNTACITLHGDATLSPLIDLIRKHDGTILRVTPHQESLEDVVVRQVKAAS